MTVPGDSFYYTLLMCFIYLFKKMNGKKDYFCTYIFTIVTKEKIKLVFDRLVCISFSPCIINFKNLSEEITLVN